VTDADSTSVKEINLNEKELGITLADIQGGLERLAEACREDGIRLACLFGSILEGTPAHQAIYQAITQNLGDFDEFARQVQAYAKK
jgi:hypothetical protein